MRVFFTELAVSFFSFPALKLGAVFCFEAMYSLFGDGLSDFRKSISCFLFL